jgi:AraC-like DNA-binding protein
MVEGKLMDHVHNSYFEQWRKQGERADLNLVNNQTEINRIVSKHLVPHKLIVNDTKNADAKFSKVDMGSLASFMLSYGASAKVDIRDLESYYVLCRPVSGKAVIIHNGQEFECTSENGRTMILSPTQEFSMAIDSDCCQRIVKISRELVEKHFCKFFGRNLTKAIAFSPVMEAEDGLGNAWWRAIDFLESESLQKDSLFANEKAFIEAQSMVITGLLHSHKHNYSDDIQARECKVAPVHVRKAELFIEANIKEALSIDEIVAASNVPKRTLYDGFKRFRGISPMCYLRNLRMDYVRKELQSCTENKNITTIALDWGFTHLGRFSIEYKKRFGESPSDTLHMRMSS